MKSASQRTELTSAPPPQTLFDIPIVIGFASGSFFFKRQAQSHRLYILLTNRAGKTTCRGSDCRNQALSFSFGDEQLARKRHRASLTGEIRVVWIFPRLYFLIYCCKVEGQRKGSRVTGLRASDAVTFGSWARTAPVDATPPPDVWTQTFCKERIRHKI